MTAADRAANIPEFVNVRPDAIKTIREQFLDDYSFVRVARECILGGDYEGATQACRKALEINPKSAEALCNLGIALRAEGNVQQAKAHFVEAIQYKPDLKEGHLNLANLLADQREDQEAMIHFREVVRIDPESFEARLPLGINLLKRNELDEAIEHLAEAVRLSPNHLSARYHLGEALHKQGRLDQAAVHYARTLEREPDHVPALLCLASIRAMSPSVELRDGQQAEKLARKACELTHFKHPQALDTLAAAYAERGRFQEAILPASQALQLAREGGHDSLADAIQRRIELYKQHKPAYDAN